MSLTRKQAIDDICGMFKTVWDATAYAARVKWENVGKKSATNFDGEDPWVRFTLRHTGAEAGSLSGGDGTKIFDRFGVLTISLFTEIGKGLSGETDYAKLIMDIYEGKRSPQGVIFRNVRIIEIGESDGFFQTNINAEFEYNEIK
ncbi:MAG: hypothetical protein PVI90_07110 [Desulfobacteraceae bacterium]|jgi:hypothetical protein